MNVFIGDVAKFYLEGDARKKLSKVILKLRPVFSTVKQPK